MKITLVSIQAECYREFNHFMPVYWKIGYSAIQSQLAFALLSFRWVFFPPALFLLLSIFRMPMDMKIFIWNRQISINHISLEEVVPLSAPASICIKYFKNPLKMYLFSINIYVFYSMRSIHILRYFIQAHTGVLYILPCTIHW